MAKLNFGGVEEEVITRGEFSLDQAKEALRGETICICRSRTVLMIQVMNSGSAFGNRRSSM